MNERIKELAEQAANEIADQFRPGFFDDRMVNDVANIIYKHHEKFAESIVKECAAACDVVAEEADAMMNSKYVSEYGRTIHEGMWGGAQNCKVEILNRFEVE